MGKSSKSKEERIASIGYISPLAKPLFDGKLAEKSIKLMKAVTDAERNYRKEAKEKKLPSKRYLRRGVAEVTKSIRKGEAGIVYLAADVFPLDIIAHLPILCEKQNIPYGYLPSKSLIGSACRSTRPTSVVMIQKPPSSQADKDIEESFNKIRSAALKANPYFD